MPLFKDWVDDMRRNREIDRDIEARRGKVKIKQHIKKQEQMKSRLWSLGKQALTMNAMGEFKQVVTQYLWTEADIKRWQRALLSFQTIEARRDQARSVSEFMGSVQAMSNSIMKQVSGREMANTQRDLEKALYKVQDMEQRLDMIMEMADDTVFTMEDLSEGEMDAQFTDIVAAMRQEAEMEASSSADARIGDLAKQIEDEMRKEIK